MLLSSNSGFVVEYILAQEALPVSSRSQKPLFDVAQALTLPIVQDLVTCFEGAWERPTSAVCTAIATVSAETCLSAGLKTMLLFDTVCFAIDWLLSNQLII